MDTWRRIERFAALSGVISLLIVVVPHLVAAVQLLDGYALHEQDIIRIVVLIMGWTFLVEICTGTLVLLVMLIALLVVIAEDELMPFLSAWLETMFKWPAIVRHILILSGLACGVAAGVWVVSYSSTAASATVASLIHIHPKAVLSEVEGVFAALKSVTRPAEVAGWIYLGLNGLLLMAFVFRGIRKLWLKIPPGA